MSKQLVPMPTQRGIRRFISSRAIQALLIIPITFMFATGSSEAQLKVNPKPNNVCGDCPDDSGGGGGGEAQTGPVYPTFTTQQQSSINLSNGALSSENYNPATVVWNSALYLGYADPNTGYVALATSTDGVNFSTPVQTTLFVGGGNTPALAVLNGALFAVYSAQGNLQVSSTTDGVNFTAPLAIPISSTVIGLPAATVLIGTLYVAYNASGYNGISGGYAPEISLVASSSGSAWSIGGTVAQGVDYQAASSPSVTVFGGQLAVVWLTQTNHYPVVALVSSGLTTTFVHMTTGIMIGGNPTAIAYNNGLFVMGRSYYSADNLWAIGTFDGATFEPQHMYGQTLRGNTALTVFNGALIQTERSNYSGNLWLYKATY